MSEPFLGQVKLFAGNFAPRGWALCDGQLLPISQNDALFSLLGTIYGGDGRTTFGLPDLRGRVAIHAGSGPGLTPRSLGSRGGTETETLNTAQLPNHTHTAATGGSLVMKASSVDGNQIYPDPTRRLAAPKSNYGQDVERYSDATPNTDLTGQVTVTGEPTTANTGGGQSHDNMQPVQAVNYIIALSGVYPSRN